MTKSRFGIQSLHENLLIPSSDLSKNSEFVTGLYDFLIDSGEIRLRPIDKSIDLRSRSSSPVLIRSFREIFYFLFEEILRKQRKGGRRPSFRVLSAIVVLIHS
ncbi:hypothetical protein NE237_019158 [Protea cynaroides]|uniref:Uncharacterized protein n=1 Tax=Protea cynaroides TaxID=273540 RepID=A0A9Q0KBC5_9MAGN|nr:hypothetical protein NE237_019158 [Protea cynaroides]